MSSNHVDINEVLSQLRAGGNMPDELVEIFNEEADEHMRNIYDGMDRLRVDSNDIAALSDVRRSSHTLKGAAAAVGFEAITRLAHRMEDLLDWLGDREQGPTGSQLELLLCTADQIQDLTSEEIDFEETAHNLVDTYGQYDSVMESLGVTNDASSEPAGEAELQTEKAATEQFETVPTVEIPEIDFVEIHDELTSGATIDPELAGIFAEEADEHLCAIGEGLEALMLDATDKTAAANVRRSSHTLKGASGAVGIMSMHRLAKRMENLLDAISHNSLTPSAEHVRLLRESAVTLFDLKAGDFNADELANSLVEMLGRFELELAGLKPVVDESVESEPQTKETTPVEQEAAKSKPKSGSGQQSQYLRVPLERLDSLVAVVGEMVINRSALNQRLNQFAERIEEMSSSLERLRGVANDVEDQCSTATFGTGTAQGKNPEVESVASFESNGLDSLEFDQYTEFHLLAGSLTEATNDIAVIASELRNIYGDFDSLLNRQRRFNREAQSGLMNVRMVPVGNITNRLERTVRTVSNKIGKKIDLVISGATTELDKTVLEEITDPLQHLIRNAMDHGVETPEQRVAAGKPERSQLTIEALNQGTQVTIRVVDDGRGLDAEKIRAKAIERGLISENEPLTESEAQSLIFMPGFSTAESLTDVSGRGVGMDVVREAVERLKGTIQVESVAGQGSTFTIHLPMSLAVSQALMVESEGHTFAIPMQSVQKVMRLNPSTITRVDTNPMIEVGERQLHLKDLASHLQIQRDHEDFKSARSVLLVRAGDDEVAVAIDSIKGGQDIVVKTLGDHLRHVPGYLGATVSGDGTVIPILDPSDLCGQQSSARSANQMHDETECIPQARRKTAMVVDDSLSVRRVTSNLLRAFGWEVIDARDGVDALEKLAAADVPPDVFLCDMEMPRMDGLELVERIRSQEEFATTPVVMVTSRAGEKHRKLAREAGANEHVVKPYNDEALISLIEHLVSEQREMIDA